MPQPKPNWTDAPPRDWMEEQAHRLAQEIRRLRGKRSANWVADRTARLGCPVTRTVISDLENGRRRYVTTAELVILAQALNTSPVALMYPGPYDETIQFLPKAKGRQMLAVQWFSGLMDGPTVESLSADFERRSLAEDKQARQEYKAAYDENLRRLRIARQIWDLDERRFALMAELRERKKKLSDDEIAEIRDTIADYKRFAEELRNRDGG